MLKSLPMASPVPNEEMTGDERQVALGLRHCHQQMTALSRQVFTSATQLGAVVNVLHARGLVSDEELDAQRKAEEERLFGLFQEEQVGVLIDTEHEDKYAIPRDVLPEIDCASRYHLCQAACCALRFPLSRQDLDEGVARWEYGLPYIIRHGDDDRCVHQDRETYQCTIYERRPGICRTYDCRTDSRIWVDFEQRIVNPQLFKTLPDGRQQPTFPQPRRATPAQPPAMVDETAPIATLG